MKTDILQIRLANEEKLAFERAAEAAGMSVSAWVRDRLRSALAREEIWAPVPLPLMAAESPASYSKKPVWERIMDLGAAIPESEREKLPRDLARNLDRYLDSDF